MLSNETEMGIKVPAGITLGDILFRRPGDVFPPLFVGILQDGIGDWRALGDGEPEISLLKVLKCLPFGEVVLDGSGGVILQRSITRTTGNLDISSSPSRSSLGSFLIHGKKSIILFLCLSSFS